LSNKEIEASRRALLSYYNSQTMAHGGYIIALVVGILTVVSRWEMFTESLVMRIWLVSALSLLSALGVYIIGRTLWYGAVTGGIIRAELDIDMSKGTVMNQLHEKATECARHDRKMIGRYFSHLNLKLMIGVFIYSLGLFFLLLIIYPYFLVKS